jgi:DNA topoisomerase-1
MDLIIVESPTKARTLARFLAPSGGVAGNGPEGQNFQIEASMGHVRDLPEKTLGIDLAHDFAPEYVVSDKKKAVVELLKKAAKNADKVILATDPDREGEAIAWHIKNILAVSGEQLEVSRITFHEITESAIKEALTHPGQINMPLVEAQQARRILDRLVGYKLSPILWRKVRRGLSAGRVQSVAVRLIVEREREVLAFKAQEYWEIESDFGYQTSDFRAKLIKQEIKNKEEADKLVEILKNCEYKVTDIQTKEVKKSPYPPFTTSTLQQAASNLFGWPAKKTMLVAQKLYEEGLITYHRTDSTNLAAEAVRTVRDYINSTYGQNYLPVEPKFYKTKSKVAQEAHEAIRPTDTEQLAVSSERLERDEKKLYELIWKRFVSCQMTEAVYKQTGVDITAVSSERLTVSYVFRANGNQIVFDGWKKVQNSDFGDQISDLPELTIGQVLTLQELIPSQHFTEPPPRYTEASLIKILEEYGIGRPSTYAPIITTICDRLYVEREEKKLIPTALGIAVNDFLMANFANILDYKFTAKMEDDLDEIANGQRQWVPVIRDFFEPFHEQLKTVTETAERVKVAVEETNEQCPQCHCPLVIRLGKFGKFLACSKFPACRFTKTFTQKLNVPCPKCGGEIVVKKTKKHRTFYGCSNYPNCDFASWNKPAVSS